MIPSIVAREMMVSNLITLSPEMDVFDAIDVLLRKKISGAPVVDPDGRFLGIFSEKSCMRFVLDAAYEQLPSNMLMAFVDRNPRVITEETDFLTVAQTFIDAACRRLPVLDDERRLKGQISRRDVMRVARQHIGAARTPVKQQGLYVSALYEDGQRPI
ncbi:CBS domain-containing protein [Stieleria marina]|uniref:Inosine-5'-monophosphate dehydrogenase n=1 Tax=Stieleria marina TaxID=1930275 RepID=A0A517NZG9_9BACT|nr:Inosine-5'-monophosphate dehydrogenase [Planctomycetes bacterium K23_9]